MIGCDNLDNKQKLNKQRHSIFDIISQRVFSMLKDGMFGYYFTSYDEANERYVKSVKRKNGTKHRGKARKSVSKLIEKSFFVNAVPKLAGLLLRITLKDYGIMMFVMGALVSVLYLLKDYVTFLSSMSLEMLIAGIAVSLCSVPMLFSTKSLARNIYSSDLCDRLLFRFLGLNKEKIRVASEEEKISIPNGALFIGITLGVISYFVSPLRLIAIIGLVTLCYCILRTPEVGVIAIIVALPFTSVALLRIFVFYVFLCYALKCIIGKRTFKFEYFDVWVVLVLAVTLVRGAISRDYVSSINNSLTIVSFILSYFVVTNLIRSKTWFRRCLLALVTSGLIVAIIAILQVIIGRISVDIPNLGRLFTSGESATSSLGNSDVLAHFLASVIPFTLVHFISERMHTKKLVGFLIGVLLVVAMWFTHSLSGIVGILCATLLLLVIYNRNFIYLAIAAVGVCPILYFTLPEKALDMLLSMKMVEGLTINGYVESLREGFRAVMSRPLGVGLMSDSKISELFNISESYSDSLIIRALIEYGLIGFVVFVCFAIMLIRLTFSYCVKAKNQYRKINCCAGFCSVTGLIASCIVSYTWYDKRIYLLFWLLVALSFAYMRIERENEAPKGAAKDFTLATLEIILTGDTYHDTVPVRRYVRSPRNKESVGHGVEIKEFEETDNSISTVKEFEQNADDVSVINEFEEVENGEE